MTDISALLSGGVVGGIVGSFVGGFAKFFWENWLPSWLTWRRGQKVEREKLLSQFRDPAIRAFSELQGHVFAIVANDGGNYEFLKRIGNERYYVTSTAYLIAAFFAWVELLRQKVAALDYAVLVTNLEQATRGFAAGQPGFQIFRLEQREIGERMLATSGEAEYCVGYAAFVEIVGRKTAPVCFRQLVQRVKYLLEHRPSEKERLTNIQHGLIDLISFIDPQFRWVPRKQRVKLPVSVGGGVDRPAAAAV